VDKIGKYPVLRKLGEGATSTVYLCNDPFAQRQVAIKRVNPEALADAQTGHLYKKLFIAEASLAGKLLHPHIAGIYDAVSDDQEKYIVMEFIEGTTLERYTQPETLLPIDVVVEMIFKCTRALDFAGKVGVLHRDIKPANILVTPDMDIKITDFGAAITGSPDQTAVAGIGSPAYMSPQQVKDHPLNHQTDIYSLGVVMYQLLAGQLPFQASSNFGMIYQITNTEPTPVSALKHDIPSAVERIVKKAMAKELEDRYQHWDDFSRDLATAFRDDSAPVAPLASGGFSDSDKFSTLRSMAFFEQFDDVELWEVSRMSQWEAVAPNQTLMKEGEEGDCFGLVTHGQLKVLRRGKLLNILDSGECFGEMGYLSPDAKLRGADIVSLSDCKVFTIKNESLRQASDGTRHAFDRSFLRILVDRLNLANQRLTG
jgi:eukaryotic-like serine/threonine-protein kinase